MMALKLLSLGRGASGVRWAIVALIEGMLAAGVVPVVPVQGSVGASGDLAPLAHMAAVMLGEGEAEVAGVRMPGGAALAEQIKAAGLQADVVVGPAMGGIVIGYELARQLGVPGIFTERDTDGQMSLRRGFSLAPGERVIIAEDVVTTGKSTLEVARILIEMGAEVLAVASLIDRTGGAAQLPFPSFALLPVAAAVYQPDACPLCAAGVPVVKPGSRPEKAF